MTEYIVVKERGVKGADAKKWIKKRFTVPDNWDNTVLLGEPVYTETNGDINLYVVYNGLQYGQDYFTIDGSTMTWTHPVLSLDPQDKITIWFVSQNY